MMLKFFGTTATNVIFMGDTWKLSTQLDSRYMGMPVKIGDGMLTLPELQLWMLDIVTGEVAIKK